MSRATKPRELEAALTPLAARAPRAALLFDVDGTLAPIVERPEDAEVPGATRDALASLASRFRLVACVSGRRAVEVRSIVGVPELTYVGNHGLERLEPGAVEPRLEPVAEGGPDVRAFIAARAKEIEAAGIRIEDKGPITALHWRGVADEPAAERAAGEIEAAALAVGIIPRPGKKVLELRPVDEIDKGTAVVALVAETGVEAALYAGDDETDLDAFRALRKLEREGRLATAVCVGVAASEEPADLERLADVIVDGVDGLAIALPLLRGA